MQEGRFAVLRDEGDCARDHALVGEDAAVAEPVGPVQPYMLQQKS